MMLVSMLRGGMLKEEKLMIVVPIDVVKSVFDKAGDKIITMKPGPGGMCGRTEMFLKSLASYS